MSSGTGQPKTFQSYSITSQSVRCSTTKGGYYDLGGSDLGGFCPTAADKEGLLPRGYVRGVWPPFTRNKQFTRRSGTQTWLSPRPLKTDTRDGIAVAYAVLACDMPRVNNDQRKKSRNLMFSCSWDPSISRDDISTVSASHLITHDI